MSRDIITKGEFEEMCIRVKKGNPFQTIEEIREELSFYVNIKSDKEIKEQKIYDKIERVQCNISITNRLLKELLEYPFDLSEENKIKLTNIINSCDIKLFNLLITKLDNKILLNIPDVTYQKSEPQPDKKSISTRMTKR